MLIENPFNVIILDHTLHWFHTKAREKYWCQFEWLEGQYRKLFRYIQAYKHMAHWRAQHSSCMISIVWLLIRNHAQRTIQITQNQKVLILFTQTSIVGIFFSYCCPCCYCNFPKKKCPTQSLRSNRSRGEAFYPFLPSSMLFNFMLDIVKENDTWQPLFASSISNLVHKLWILKLQPNTSCGALILYSLLHFFPFQSKKKCLNENQHQDKKKQSEKISKSS